VKAHLALALIALCLAGCPGGQPPLPEPSQGGTGSATAADKYADASDAAESKAGAAVGAAKVAVAQVGESPAKAAASAELKVAEAFLSKPTAADIAEALARVKKRLAGEDLSKADAALLVFADSLERERVELWSRYESEKVDNAAKIAAIKADAERKVAEAKADAERKVAAANSDAAKADEAKRNYLFAALGAGLVALGTLLLAFGGFIPGGRIAGGFMILGGIISAAVPGLIEKVLNSTWFPWLVGGCVGLVGLVGCAILARRFLFKPKPEPSAVPVPTPSENESNPSG
jgi:hypothetical protein